MTAMFNGSLEVQAGTDSGEFATLPRAVPSTIYLVADDNDLLAKLSEALECEARQFRSFSSGEEFLACRLGEEPSCLITDERLPGMAGSELLRRLTDQGQELPIIIVTANATTPFTVAAMRRGAEAVIEKPFTRAEMSETVDQAIASDAQRRQRNKRVEEAKQRIANLSPSEREVLDLVLVGTPNKQIAKQLGVCVRTIESRRSRIYQTTAVNSVAALVRLCVAAELIEA